MIFTALSAALQADSVDVKLGMSQLPLSFKMGGNGFSVGRIVSLWEEIMLFYPNIEIAPIGQ